MCDEGNKKSKMLTTTSGAHRCVSIDIGVVNLALCVTDFTQRCDGTYDFNLVHVERATIGRARESIQALGKKLLVFYRSNDALNSGRVDFVFVEQQLSRASKNIALAHVTAAYFETMNLLGDDATKSKVVMVSPRNKFRAIRQAFREDILSSIDFDRHGRHLKALSVDIASLLFRTFDVEVGLNAFSEYRSKLDDVADVFLQSFAFFLEGGVSQSGRWCGIGIPSVVGVEQDGQGENPEKQAQ